MEQEIDRASARLPGFAATATLLALALAFSGCGMQPGPYRETDRDRVGADLRELERGLQTREWNRVERFFGSEFSGGVAEIRNRIEDRRERVVQLQFIVNRVLERDGLLNAQVRWNKSFLDTAGRPQKRSGVSEFILKPQGEGFRILSIAGDQPF